MLKKDLALDNNADNLQIDRPRAFPEQGPIDDEILQVDPEVIDENNPPNLGEIPHEDPQVIAQVPVENNQPNVGEAPQLDQEDIADPNQAITELIAQNRTVITTRSFFDMIFFRKGYK